ncbi:unnamed protein product [Rangifer tarandus platyrhynchus]|uniref:Uncharacterized protein n=2 Tax=Rangifer tarandus platyrhynchus TaxID=3082113 RepID=A0ABN8XXE4_RANTA|nr:unnamed protein product [Rangifer tarandus platyrhynchus]CAI9713589.1 unnamed protein product [Rangifer tarandus platyrhynchus]
MSASHPLPAKPGARVPAVRIPASAPPRARTHPGSPAGRACLPGGLAVSTAAEPRPPLLLRGYIARSAMFPVSPGARRATTTGWVGAKGAGAGGRGGRLSHSFPLSTQASPSY